MVSIRRKLLTSILSVILAVTILLALVTYFSVREEMDEFYDENLKLVAQSILATEPTTSTKLNNIEVDHKLRGEEEYLIQVWRKNKLDYSSHPFVEFPLQYKDGKGRTHFNNSIWRFYAKSNGDITVQLAQDLRERHSVVIEIYGFLLIPIAIQFPILAILIWLLIGYGVKPLRDISDLIRNRNSSYLEPLSQDNVPEEIQGLVNALNGLLSRLKQSLQVQRQFTADAAHELRTPLSAVRLQLDILKRADSEEEAKVALLTLEKGVVRSTRLVQQLLELARQEPENIEIEFGQVDLAQVIEEAVEQALPIAEAENISLLTRITDQPVIIGNAAKLAVMINNLINNAITYTNSGGQVEVSLNSGEQEIVLAVADNGMGIPQKDHERVFDRFYRVAGTGATGSGLGLSIVRSVAELHKADVSLADGINGQGVTFRILFKKHI